MHCGVIHYSVCHNIHLNHCYNTDRQTDRQTGCGAPLAFGCANPLSQTQAFSFPPSISTHFYSSHTLTHLPTQCRFLHASPHIVPRQKMLYHLQRHGNYMYHLPQHSQLLHSVTENSDEERRPSWTERHYELLMHTRNVSCVVIDVSGDRTVFIFRVKQIKTTSHVCLKTKTSRPFETSGTTTQQQDVTPLKNKAFWFSLRFKSHSFTNRSNVCEESRAEL